MTVNRGHNRDQFRKTFELVTTTRVELLTIIAITTIVANKLLVECRRLLKFHN